MIAVAAQLHQRRRRAGESMPDVIELRGEIYVSLAEFRRINAERRGGGREGFPTRADLPPERFASRSEEVRRRNLEIVFYGTGRAAGVVAAATQRGRHEMIKRWGLPAWSSIGQRGGADELVGPWKPSARAGRIPVSHSSQAR